MKKTKIVATIGPASETVPVLKSLVKAGVNVCRLNFSHGQHSWHKKTIANIRKVEKDLKKKIAIIADIQGPRVRIANHKELVLRKGDKVYLTDERSPHSRNHKKNIILDWNGFYAFLKTGDVVFVEDGLIQMKVTKREKTGCVAEVTIPGTIKMHKGVNIPSISHHLGFLTNKDLVDLEFILSQDVDGLAVSFVGNSKDLRNLRTIMEHLIEKRERLNGNKGKGKKSVPWIISKVERKKAMKNIDEIVKLSDGIMVARGDLAIEMPQEKVTIYQKDIIKKCLKQKKPVIVATQMMASMVDNIRPTRAEIADVTNAVIDNADAVMLSNETAVGAYPEDVISTMSDIIECVEESEYNDLRLKSHSSFARLLSLAKKSKKKKSVSARSLEEAVEFSFLRQEDVRIIFRTRKAEDKRKAMLLWGVE
jgi:pyruvate kinase